MDRMPIFLLAPDPPPRYHQPIRPLSAAVRVANPPLRRLSQTPGTLHPIPDAPELDHTDSTLTPFHPPSSSSAAAHSELDPEKGLSRLTIHRTNAAHSRRDTSTPSARDIVDGRAPFMVTLTFLVFYIILFGLVVSQGAVFEEEVAAAVVKVVKEPELSFSTSLLQPDDSPHGDGAASAMVLASGGIGGGVMVRIRSASRVFGSRPGPVPKL